MIFSHESQPLTRNARHDIAHLLASAFAEDQGMDRILGKARWQRIAFRYFDLQLNHPDCIITAVENSELRGVLLASSPANNPSLLGSISELLGMMWLLGSHYQQSQKIAEAVIAELPTEPVWYINQLAVHPDHQHQGLGQALLHELDTRVPSGPVYVDCEFSLEKFYLSAGYELSSHIESAGLAVMTKTV